MARTPAAPRRVGLERARWAETNGDRHDDELPGHVDRTTGHELGRG